VFHNKQSLYPAALPLEANIAGIWHGIKSGAASSISQFTIYTTEIKLRADHPLLTPDIALTEVALEGFRSQSRTHHA
jgi:hypothetical protein